MFKRVLLLLALISLFGFAAKSQQLSYGIKGGIAYSSYELSNGYVFYNTEGNAISYHAGVFIRRALGKYFLQADLNFASGMKANMDFRGNGLSFSKSSLNVPLLFGRNFYPGTIRVYAGISPGMYFSKDEIASFLIDNRLLPSGQSGSSIGISYVAGSGIDLLKSKFSIDVRYDRNFYGGFYYEDKNTDIRTYHRFSNVILGLAYKIQ